MLKKFGSEWANIKIFLKNFFCLSAEKFRSGTLHCCIISRYRQSLDTRRGEYHDHLSKFFLSHSAEKFRRESFTVALFPGSGKVWIGGEGEVSRFSVENLCLTVPKISVGETFTVAIILGVEKVWIRVG